MAALRSTLLPHQEVGVAWCLEKELEGCLLADDMGLGKTVTACGVIVKKPVRTLVVAPIALLDQWKNEIAKHTEGVSAMIYDGKRDSSEFEGHTVIITNQEKVLGDFKKGRIGVYDGFERLIVDEAHGLRNPKSKVYEAMKAIFGGRTDVRKVFLSGTPICNKSKDFMTLVSLLNIPNLSDMAYWNQMKDANEVVAALHKIRTEHVLRRTKEQILGTRLPKKEVRDVPIRLDESAVYESEYSRIRGMYMKPVIKKILRLRQCVNNVAYVVEAEAEAANAEVSAKVNYIRETVAAVPEGEKIVIFSQWTSMLEHIATEIDAQAALFHGKMNAAERRATLERFNNDPDLKVLLVSLKSGGCGLNLIAANHVILTEPYFNVAEEKQAIDRVYRIGQTRDVTIHKLFVPGTIESWMHQLQKLKSTISDAVLDGIHGETSIDDEKKEKNDMFKVLIGQQ